VETITTEKVDPGLFSTGPEGFTARYWAWQFDVSPRGKELAKQLYLSFT